MTREERRIYSVSEMAGKTIKAVAGYDGDHTIVLAFTDETWIQFTGQGDNGAWGEIATCQSEDMDKLVRAGVVSDEEWKAIQAEQEKVRKEYERATYERLRAQFEGR